MTTIVKTEDYLRDVVTILFVQRGIIVPIIAFIFAATLAVAFLWPPTYEVEGAVLFKGKKPKKSPEALENTEIKMFEISTEDLVAEMNIVASHDVAERTILALNGEGEPFEGVDQDSPDKKDHVTNLQKRLSAEILPDSNIVRIALSDRDPDRALTVLGVLMNEYVAHRAALNRPEEAVNFYESQAEKFRQAMTELEDKLIVMAQRFQSANPAKEIESNLAIKKDLEQQLNKVRSAWIEKQLYVEYLENALQSDEIQFFLSIENPSINLLGEKLQTLFIERGNVQRAYQPGNEKVRAMNKQIEDTYESLLAEVESYTANQRNEARILEGKTASIKERLEAMASKNIQLHTYFMESRRLEREMDLLKHSYETFAKRLEEARIGASAEANNLFSISIISAPSYGEAVFPKKQTLIPIGLIAGLITGLSLGFLREYFDHTFKKPEDIQEFSGLNPLFSIPDWEAE